MLSSPSRANPDFPPFFVSRQERLLQKYKLKLADVMESIEKKDAEIECLKQLAEDKKELHTVEMELKGIELEKKDLEIDNLKIEISKLKAEIDEQSKIIEALATSQHENVTCNWFSALPDLFLDLI
jgi:predicted RNase H-like nuclease (RuvC/YqgF family)